MVLGWIITPIIIFLTITIKIVYEYERGVVFTLGKFSGIKNPGLRLVIPVFQTWEKVDMRTMVADVPEQDAITKDNVSININAVTYYKVIKAEDAIIKVEDYDYAISQLAQTTMRDIIGEFTLDQVLGQRDEISNKIQSSVDMATDPWGIKVQMVELKDVLLPANMKRSMAREAEAEREKRAVILKAQGEAIASTNLSKAATILAQAKGALHLRTLQSLNDVSSDQTNTIVFAVPLEVINAYENAPVRRRV
jgi:regulator of protease activity HflC (stomatin/prohibitin superfamily)